MTAQEKAPSPLPCGEGAGGEGREAAALASPRAEKRGHGYAPNFGEKRQKDGTRTNLRAARLRKQTTPSEKLLWKLLRSIDGHTFRRQPPIGDYVFDFACYGARLLIELDRSIHERADVKKNDRDKTVYAIKQGHRLLRFANNDVWDRPAWVIAQARVRLNAPHPPTPSPQGRGGDEQ